MCDILGIGVVGTGFSAGAGEFIEGQASSEISRIFLFKCGRIERVKCRAHIGGQHAAVRKRAAKLQVGIVSCKLHHFSQGVFKEMGPHAGCADRTDFFLVHQYTAGSAAEILRIKKRPKGRIRADTVVLPVAKHHAAVQAGFPGFTCRNDLKLGRQEILLFYSVLIQQDFQDGLFDRFLFRSCLSFASGCGRSIDDHRARSDHKIQIFALHNLGCFLLHEFV